MGLRDNIFINLKGGDRVTLRNGDVLSYDEYYDKITNTEDSRLNYTDTLLHKTRRELDIVEVKRPIDYKTIFTEQDREDDNYSDEEIDEILGRVKEQLKQTKKSDAETITINV